MPFHLHPPRDRRLYRLAKTAPMVTLPRGEALYAPGDPGDQVFLVREGHVRLVLPAMRAAGPYRTVALALPWELFGDEALTEGHRRYGAVAGAGCLVQPLPGSGVLRGLKSARKSLDAYLLGVEQELHRLRHAQGGSHGPAVAQRLAEVLLDLGRRCGEQRGRGLRLSERLTHQVLADLAGAHRATVTTLLNDWIYEGVLATDAQGHLVLARPTGLWSRAGYHPPEAEQPAGPRPR